MTEETVRKILELGGTRKDPGKITQREIGERFGLAQQSVSQIIRGRCWGHMGGKHQNEVKGGTP